MATKKKPAAKSPKKSGVDAVRWMQDATKILDQAVKLIDALPAEADMTQLALVARGWADKHLGPVPGAFPGEIGAVGYTPISSSLIGKHVIVDLNGEDGTSFSGVLERIEGSAVLLDVDGRKILLSARESLVISEASPPIEIKDEGNGIHGFTETNEPEVPAGADV